MGVLLSVTVGCVQLSLMIFVHSFKFRLHVIVPVCVLSRLFFPGSAQAQNMNAAEDIRDDPLDEASRAAPDRVIGNIHFYVGGWKPNTATNLINHIKLKGIQVIKCERLLIKTDSPVPFIVTVKASDREKMLNPDIWPCNVFVKRYYLNKWRMYDN